MSIEKAAELLAQAGLNFSELVRDTHADMVMRSVALVEERFQLVLTMKMRSNNEAVTDAMFKGNGSLATLAKKIEKAHDLGLLDDVGYQDATLIRKVRNQFAHTKQKLHIDSGTGVELIRQMSTFEAAGSNQDAFLAAQTKVLKQLDKSIGLER